MHLYMSKVIKEVFLSAQVIQFTEAIRVIIAVNINHCLLYLASDNAVYLNNNFL